MIRLWKRSNLFFVFLLTTVFFFIVTPDLIPSNADPCNELLRSEEDTKDSYIKKISQLIANIFSTPEVSTEKVPEGFLFTNGTGYSLTPTCDKHVREERSVYYPIGLVVKPLGSKKITVDGESVNYHYVVAEHGLHLYLPKPHLQELKKDKVYLFADGVEPVPYCVGAPSCNFEDAMKRGQVIHPNYSYGVAEMSAELDRTLGTTHCSTIKFTPYHLNRKKGWEIAYQQPAYLSPCITDPDSGKQEPNGSLKIFSKTKATEIFKAQINGSFQRMSSSLIQEILPIITSIKECQDINSTSKVITLGAFLRGEVDFKILKSGAEATIKSIRTATSLRDKGYFYLYSTYIHRTLDPIDLKLESKGSKIKFHDIRSVATCKDLNPEKPFDIYLYNDKFLGGSISLSPPAIEEIYTTSFKRKGFSPVTDPNTLRLGKFWKIKGSDQYFFWRTVLRRKIQGLNQLEPILRKWPNREQRLVVDFFTHLILSSSFEFIPTKKKDIFQ